MLPATVVFSGTMLLRGSDANGPITQSCADGAAPADKRKRLNHRVRPDADIGFNISVDRVDDAHARIAQLPLNSFLHGGIGFGKLLAGIGRDDILGHDRLHRDHFLPALRSMA